MSPIKKTKPISFFLKILPLFVLAHFVHHLLAALLIPLSPFIRDDFALDYTQTGWVVSAFTLAYGVSHLPAGWLADRTGPRVLLIIGISGVALAGLLVGLSPTYVLMVIFLVLLGLLGGGYHPSASPLLSSLTEAKNQGKALGIHQIGGGASHFLAPLIAVAIASALGWRGSFIWLAVPTIIFGIVFYVLLGRWGYSQKVTSETTDSHIDMPPNQSRLRQLVVFLTLSIAVQILIHSVMSFVPLFVVDNYGVSEEIAAALLSLVYSGGIWAGPLGDTSLTVSGKSPL